MITSTTNAKRIALQTSYCLPRYRANNSIPAITDARTTVGPPPTSMAKRTTPNKASSDCHRQEKNLKNEMNAWITIATL